MAAEITLLLSCPEDTDAFGFALGEAIDEPLVIGLVGEMGSGKTTFVRGLARGLGVQEVVNSPTYTLMKRYEGRMRLDHLDAWLEGREREVLADGAHQLLGREGVCVVEWADRAAELFPESSLWVDLAYRGDEDSDVDRRTLSFSGGQPHLRAVLEELSAAYSIDNRLELGKDA